MERKQKTIRFVAVLLVLGGLIALPTVVGAGDLEPSGPPDSTMKTLDEVEPRIPIPGSDTPVGVFNIFQSGSYYLTGDRNTSTTGINVFADNVTIDLEGYSLIGSGQGTYNGIIIGMAAGANVEIRNGTVRNFGGMGIYEDNSAGKNHRVIAVRVLSNRGGGIFLAGIGHLVKDCTVSDNGNSGVLTVFGIYTGYGCTVTGNTVHGNGYSATGLYVYGILAGSGSTVTGNTAYYNGISATSFVYGIYLTGNNLVDQNTAYNNSGINMNSPGNCTFGVNHAP